MNGQAPPAKSSGIAKTVPAAQFARSEEHHPAQAPRKALTYPAGLTNGSPRISNTLYPSSKSKHMAAMADPNSGVWIRPCTSCACGADALIHMTVALKHVHTSNMSVTAQTSEHDTETLSSVSSVAAVALSCQRSVSSTLSACASVLKTHWSTGSTSGGENSRKAYLRVSAIQKDCMVLSLYPTSTFFTPA